MKYFIWLIFLISSHLIFGQYVSDVWVPDNGDGTYTNPIIHADYSDPDICQAGDDFYMTSSSFNAIPGLPILHSKDLVNWKIINHALPANVDPHFDIPQHGNGVWAPSFRYHDGTFYIYWGDPDRGIFMVKTDDPAGDWSQPILVKKAYGNIDPCPLWDDDGKVYMVHAFAHSRAGIKSVLQVVELSADGSRILDKGTVVFDGHKDHPTIEGPKFYKRNGYYYIFAPGGGVTEGWQTILRSKNIFGPYEDKIVLAQGDTDINGPHQGGYVELDNGEGWFIHFQDKGGYGRIAHLEPVKWVDDWPVMGSDPDKDGTGEPVITHKKPKIKGKHPIVTPQESDEFEGSELGLQWQWSANPRPQWYSLNSNPGHLRLTAVTLPENSHNLWMAPNLLTQKLPAQEFQAITKLNVSNLKDGEETGLVIFGLAYGSMTVKRIEGKLYVDQMLCFNADKGTYQKRTERIPIADREEFWLKASVDSLGRAEFFYSIEGEKFLSLGPLLKLEEGKWVGAKIGLYVTREEEVGAPGSVDFDWIHIEPYTGRQ